MSFTILDVRIGQVGVEASRAALDKQAAGPLGNLGTGPGYDKLFDQARAKADSLALPWTSDQPYRNKFWKNYVTDRMLAEPEDQWAAVARKALVPIKAPAPLPQVRLHPDQVRSYSEAFGWPTGIGIVWNSWIRTEMDVDGLVALLDQIRNGKIAHAASDGTAGAAQMQSFYHELLKAARTALWGETPQGLRSEPITIVSIVQGAADPADPALVAAAREALLDGIYQVWDKRPAPLPDDKRAAGGDTVYVAEGFRLGWSSANFLSEGRKRRSSCLHRNLLFATLQVEMIATAARHLAAHRQQKPDLAFQYQSTVDRLLHANQCFLTGSVYSAPHLRAQLLRPPVVQSFAELAA